VRECWNRHLAAAGDHWQLLWSILMFRQWLCRWAPGHHDQPHDEHAPESVVVAHAA